MTWRGPVGCRYHDSEDFLNAFIAAAILDLPGVGHVTHGFL